MAFGDTRLGTLAQRLSRPSKCSTSFLPASTATPCLAADQPERHTGTSQRPGGQQNRKRAGPNRPTPAGSPADPAPVRWAPGGHDSRMTAKTRRAAARGRNGHAPVQSGGRQPCAVLADALQEGGQRPAGPAQRFKSRAAHHSPRAPKSCCWTTSRKSMPKANCTGGNPCALEPPQKGG